jgi:hypothetical protein
MRNSIGSTSAVQNDCWFPVRVESANKVSMLNPILASHSMTVLKRFLRFEAAI